MAHPEQAAELIARTRAQLRARGERMTAPRRAVVTVLGGAHDHLSADEISARLGESSPEVHRATVYRTLEALTRLGLVQHVHVSNGATKYHLSEALHGQRHVHAQCVHCGDVVDVPSDILELAGRRLVDDFGFHLDAGHVALSGTCATCAAELGASHERQEPREPHTNPHRPGGTPTASRHGAH